MPKEGPNPLKANRTEEENLELWNYFVANPQLPTKQIAEKWGISQPAMSKVLTRLIKKYTKLDKEPDKPDSNYW